MDAVPQMWMFFLMVFGIIVLPGMDMAVVMANALAGGRARGMLALAGVIAGGVCHVVASALGIGLIVQAFPAVFNTLLLAGAAYVAWIGWSLWRHAREVHLPAASAAVGPWATFRQAALTNLLNPKAYLFMLAVFPQFLRPERGDVWLQSALLWLVIAATQAVVYGGVALAAAGAVVSTLA